MRKREMRRDKAATEGRDKAKENATLFIRRLTGRAPTEVSETKGPADIWHDE